MAGPQIKLEMTGDEQKLARALTRSEVKIGKLEEKLRKAGTAGTTAGDKIAKVKGKTDTGFSTGSLTKYIGMLGPGLGVLGALKLVTAELQRQKTIQAESASAQITLNQARQTLLRNMTGRTPGEIRGALGAAGAISAETGVGERFIAKGLADAISASGGDIAASIAAVRQSAKVLADVPEAIAGFAGSLLDLSKVTGTIDAMVNQGLLQTVGALSRVVDPQQQAKNIPRSLIGQMAFGATAQGSAALFAALTTGGADITGATSGTAAISLAQQLEKFLPKLETMGDRIAALQDKPELAAEFLGKASFEKVVLGPIRTLLTDTQSVVANQFRQNLQAIPGEAGLRRVAEQAIANRSLDPTEATRRIGAAFDVAIQQSLTRDLAGGRAGATRKGLTRFRELLPEGSVLGDKIRSIVFELRSQGGLGQAIPAALKEMENIRQELLQPTRTITRTRVGGLRAGSLITESRAIAPTERQEDLAALLARMITELQLIHSEAQQTNVKLDILNANSRRAPAEIALGSPAIDR